MSEMTVGNITTIPPNTGWMCPKCGRVYSPWCYECTHCNTHTVTNPITTTGDPYPSKWETNTVSITNDPCPHCGGNRWEPAGTGCAKGSHYGIWI